MKPTIHDFFKEVEDPRKWRNVQHKLLDIIIISILAVICGAEGWEEIELFGKSKEGFLKEFLELPKGIPSHDTFRRVFMYMNPESFGKSFMSWTASLREKIKGEIIPIDGKCLRGSKDSFHKRTAIHMVSAWAESNQLVLGQIKVDEKSNEITAIPKLLELLDLKNTIVTIDAMGTQTAIAEKIIDQGADYILALKGNQEYLKEAVEKLFEQVKPIATHQTIEKGHGRIETRTCSVINKLELLDEEKDRWKKLQSVVSIEAIIETQGKVRKEIRYFISSLSPDAQLLNGAIRKHWGIEIKLHWSLDVCFREDDSRKRTEHSAENFSTVRKIALNLLKQDSSLKLGLKGKRLNAAWNNEYLKKILGI